ncbi:hypothetical protein CFR80_00010 [Komagataeibacter oboediens]|uniref:Uncharacterized protein n=1 Tax=Komagataeibacter oboediens TaxID=65958 RepID=A0A318QZZ8_9PROT|nr:hypothetical protein CFR80_00010 [Komagataeibacter oboediens]
MECVPCGHDIPDAVWLAFMHELPLHRQHACYNETLRYIAARCHHDIQDIYNYIPINIQVPCSFPEWN